MGGPPCKGGLKRAQPLGCFGFNKFTSCSNGPSCAFGTLLFKETYTLDGSVWQPLFRSGSSLGPSEFAMVRWIAMVGHWWSVQPQLFLPHADASYIYFGQSSVQRVYTGHMWCVDHMTCLPNLSATPFNKNGKSAFICWCMRSVFTRLESLSLCWSHVACVLGCFNHNSSLLWFCGMRFTSR